MDCPTPTASSRRIWVSKQAYVEMRLSLALDRFMQKRNKCRKVRDARWVNAWSVLYNKLGTK